MPGSGPRLPIAEIYAASEYGSLKNEISRIQISRIQISKIQISETQIS